MESINTPLISIVVPAYNIEPWIGECLGSLASQTYRNIEVVVVDDESADATADAAEAFCKADSRFSLIKASHGGLSATRNKGIEAATGDWLLFVDGDDCLEPWAVETLVHTAMSLGADAAIGGMRRGKRYSPSRRPVSETELWSYAETMSKALYQHLMINHACGALMRRRLVTDNGGFREGILYEDLDSFYRFYEQAGRIAWTSAPLYFYRRTPGSILDTWKPQRLDVLDVTDRLLEFMQARHPDLVRAAEDRRFSAHFNMLVLMLRLGIDDNKAIERCRKVIKKYRARTLADPRVRLKNKLGAIASYGGTRLIRALSLIVG
ncbi:MAG: glycosyltransferase [Duncaniella sp.]|nr:glycosyltransferase [Duncaniella sp.]